MASWISLINKIARNFFCFMWLYFIVQGGLQLLVYGNPPIILPGWFPFDTTSGPGYEIAMVFQMFSSIVATTFIYGFPPFYDTFICVAGSQLEKLRGNVLLVKGDIEHFKTNIRNHHKILEYMNLIEEAFNPLMLLWFLMLTTTLCTASFSAAVSQEGFQFVLSVVVYVLGLVLVLMFCWFTDKLTEQAYKVGEAAYGMDWTESPVSFQRCIIMFIAIANREFSLSAGKILPVNREIMKNMIENSVSLFMFLMNVKDLELRRNAVVNLIELTNSFSWEDNENWDEDTGNRTMASWNSLINKIACNFFCFMWLYFIVQGGLQLLVYGNPPIILPGWFPFDTTSSPGYDIAIVFQIYSRGVVTTFIYGFPPFYATFICIAGSQLEKLRGNMLLVKGDIEHFKTNIRNHQKILEYTNLIEETFSPLMLLWFLVLTTSLCTASFSAAVSQGVFQFVRSLVVYVIGLVLVLMFCWFTDKLTDQAYNVGEAAYGMDWTESPFSFQRSIIMVIAIANREFSLSAGKILPVNREIMKNMIENSVSLFMSLMTVKDLE